MSNAMQVASGLPNDQIDTRKRLRNKVVIVTGAGNGIGAEAAALFAAEGAKVVCADVAIDQARRVSDAILEQRGESIAIACNVTVLEECEAMAKLAAEKYGTIDGIYVNAGIHGGETADAISEAEWRRVIEVNLNGAFFSAKAVLPTMMANGGGSIVLQGSICAHAGIKGTVSYTASKAGLIGAGRQMAVEYADQGIRVNSISPGTARTNLVESLYVERASVRGTTAEGDLAKTAASYPMKRLVNKSEIAQVALFLLSDESSFVTGVDIPVDGGFVAS